MTRHVNFEQMQADLKERLGSASNVPGITASDAEAATVVEQRSQLQKIILEHITHVERAYGVGLNACFQLYGHLQREKREQRGWFSCSSPADKAAIGEFLEQYAYIDPAYQIVQLIKNSKLALFAESQRIVAGGNLGDLEKESFSTVRDFFFKLMRIIHPILERINDADFSDHFKKLFLQKHLLFYTACNATINTADTFTEIAHALFCNAIIDRSGVFGGLSFDKRKLISALLHYLKNCPINSGNIQHAHTLFFRIISDPECVLRDALPLEDALLPSQGALVKVRQCATGFFQSYTVSFLAQRVAAAVVNRLPGSNFMDLLASFRSAQEQTQQQPTEVACNHEAMYGFLSDSMSVLGYDTYKFANATVFQSQMQPQGRDQQHGYS